MRVDHFAHNDVVVALPDNRLYLAFHRAEDRRPASTAQERLSRQSAVLQLCRPEERKRQVLMVLAGHV
jgi:hypothetical protein